MKNLFFAVVFIISSVSFADTNNDKTLSEIFESGNAIRITVTASGIRVPADEWSVDLGQCAISMREPSDKVRVLKRNREITVTKAPGHWMFRMMTELDRSVLGIILPEHTRVNKIGAGSMVNSPGGIYKYQAEVEKRQAYTFGQLKEDCGNSGIRMDIVPLPADAYEEASLNNNEDGAGATAVL